MIIRNQSLPKEILDFSDFKFRAHMCGNLMVDAKEKSVAEKLIDLRESLEEKTAKCKLTKNTETKTYKNLIDKISEIKLEISVLEKTKNEPVFSETCISALEKIFIKEKTGRAKDIESKYFEKGKSVEGEGVELLQDVKEIFVIKNDLRKSNQYIEGECDIDMEDEDTILDIKSCWDLYTFYPKYNEKISKIYWWQGQCYMDLFGREKFILVNTLINTPDFLIEKECNKYLYEIGVNNKDSTEYLIACREIRKNLTFDDIPKNEKIIFSDVININRDEIKRLYEKIILCRIWLNNFAIDIYNKQYGTNFEMYEYPNTSSESIVPEGQCAPVVNLPMETAGGTTEAKEGAKEQPEGQPESVITETIEVVEFKGQPKILGDENMINLISNLQSFEDCIDFYRKNPDIKNNEFLLNNLKNKRNSFSKKQEDSKKPSFSINKKPTSSSSVEKKQDDVDNKLKEDAGEEIKMEVADIDSEKLKEAIRIKADLCKEPQQIRDIYREHVKFISLPENRDIKIYLGQRGETLEKHSQKEISKIDL